MSSKHIRAATLFLTSLVVLFFAAFSATAQAQRPQLTAEWIFGKEGSSVAEVQEFKWLADNFAIIYDTRQPEAQRGDRLAGSLFSIQAEVQGQPESRFRHHGHEVKRIGTNLCGYSPGANTLCPR